MLHISSSDVSISNPSNSPWVSEVSSISISLVSNQSDFVVHSFSAVSNNTIFVWAPSWDIEDNWNCSLFESDEVSFLVLDEYIFIILANPWNWVSLHCPLINCFLRSLMKISKSHWQNSSIRFPNSRLWNLH